ncbi:MAG: hypothetical protein Q8P50_18945 [Bacillota bacterium]|nr:hypothetical protein [Bacillota bacterium]
MPLQPHELSPLGRNLIAVYLQILQYLVDAGFAGEIDWQDSRSIKGLSESEFLGEFAWVVLCSGFRERVVRSLFSAFSKAFLDWSSAQAIVEDESRCVDRALRVFQNRGKVMAVAALARQVVADGFPEVRERLAREGLDYIRELPHMGPVTSRHLAKNIGLGTVKPDRHLVKIASTVGVQSPQELCEMISDATGDSPAVVDLVLWRYATINKNYLQVFLQATR